MKCDLTDSQAVDLGSLRIDVIVHAAAAMRGTLIEQLAHTVTGTANLLQAARKAGVSRIIGLSSLAVLDFRSARAMTLIDEHVPVAPAGDAGVYAQAKILQENLFERFGAEANHASLILRPGLVYDDRRLIPAHAGIVRGDLQVLVSHPGQVPTIEVRGLARAVVAGVEGSFQGVETVHLVDDALPSQGEYLAGLRRRGLLNSGGLMVPWKLLQSICTGARLAMRAVGLTARVPEVLLPGSFCARLKPFEFNNLRARQLLGWIPGQSFGSRNGSPSTLRNMAIAYFTALYPRATDTFIQREVEYLRLHGMDVSTYSVRCSGSEHDVSESIREEKRKTRYLLPVKLLALMAENMSVLLRSPLRYLATLRLALRTSQPGWRGLALQMAYFQEAILLASKLRSDGIKHLHNHLGDSSGTVALLSSMLAQISYSITFHGPHIFFDPMHWALREKVRHASFIVCISHYCRSQMMLFSDAADWDKLKIVHCGVDARRMFPLASGTRAEKLLYTGRLSMEKGLSVLFQSLKLLRDAGRHFELTLVGDGADRGRLEDLARELAIDRHIVFAGYRNQEQVGEYLRRSDIFILPSFAEGVPVSLMEAMATGIPVVATNVGGVAELVESERTGLVVPPADSAGLANAIARYQDDHELRGRVAAQGRERVIQHYNIETEGDKLLELFARAENLPSP